MAKNKVRGADAYILCFYHAGGNANTFSKWISKKGSVEFMTIELPGHGFRYAESCSEDLSELIPNIVQEIITRKIEKPIFLYGHSMGALIAFETASYIKKNKIEIDLRGLIISGRHAPNQEEPSKFRTKDGKEGLIEELRRMNFTDESLLNNKSFLDFYVPILMSDYLLGEKYIYDGTVLDIPIIAHCGNEDFGATFEHMKEWNKMTNKEFSQEVFNGGHFFVYDDTIKYDEILKSIVKKILK